nr:unnamed protein product [Callosobruchus analis]
MANQPSFIKDFIDIYRKHNCLWQVKSPEYANKQLISVAYEELLQLFKTVSDDATIEAVKNKINNMRSAFRKELKKVKESKRSGTSSEQVYIPTLWYYDSLLFTIQHEQCREAISSCRDFQEEEENETQVENERNPNTESHCSFNEARNDTSKEKHKKKIKNKILSSLSPFRTFWSVAKPVSQNFSYLSTLPLTRKDKSIASTPKEKSDILGKLFAANSTADFQGNTPATIFNVNSRVAEVKFQHRDVKYIIQYLNTNKASGSEPTPATVLKSCVVELTPILCKLFKILYEQDVFPASWKIGCVQPIPEKGKKTDPTNYRPVPLLSIMSKVMKTVINTQLLKHIDNNNIYNRQYGFRKHRSTGDLLAYVTHIRGPDVFSINAEIPQESVLSPTLFLLYINELLEITSNLIYSFADDSTLISCVELGKPLPSQEIARRRHPGIIMPHRSTQISNNGCVGPNK